MKGRNRVRLSGRLIVLSMVVLLAGAVLLQYSIDNATATQAGWKDSSPFDTTRSILDVLGGMRETLAGYLWSKTDDIHHGYYGADVTKEQALYPYYWLMTRLDPHFTMAYYYASFMLCRLGKIDSGFNFAMEGLRYNPDSPLMQENLAEIYFFFKKDPAKARYHLLKAIQLTNSEQDKEVYSNLLSAVDEVLTGKRKQSEVTPLKQAAGLDKFIDEYNKEHGINE